MTEENTIETALTGSDLLSNPLLNKGTAFPERERDTFGLHGFLPPHIGCLEEQIDRRMQALHDLQSDFERYVFLRGLQDANETLFYALVTRNLEETLPLVYTPTVGEGAWPLPELAASQSDRRNSRPSPLRPDRGDRRERRRAHPWPRRPGRRRHGHPDRQAVALYRLRRAAPRNDLADPARRRHRQSRPPRRPALCGLAARAHPRPGLRRLRRGLRHRRPRALAAGAAAMGGLRRVQR